MKRILLVSIVDPSAHSGGAGAYTRGLVAALRHGPDECVVDLVAPKYPPPGRWPRVRRITSFVRSSMSRYPAKVLFTRCRHAKRRIRQLIRFTDYDAIVLNGSDMGWAVEDIPSTTPTILIAHNIEHHLLAQQASRYRWLSALLHREVIKHRRYETEMFRLVNGVVFVSATEMAWSLKHMPGLRAMHVPPLFVAPAARRKSPPGRRLRLGYLADCAWWPNRENWTWLIQEVLPKVRRPLELHAFGRWSEGLPVHEQAVLHGKVDDLSTVWAQVDIMACPIHAGAGVSVKVAESLYNRVPVLATTRAVRGLAVLPGPGLAVLDRAEEWAAFLNSTAADRLAEQTPAQALSELFGVSRQGNELNQFILQTAPGVRDGRRRPADAKQSA